MKSIKDSFPIFSDNRKGNFLYLDSASTTLKHKAVINSLNQYNSQFSANVHRGLYPIAEKATNEFEKVRSKVAKFINSNKDEIIFTKNTTESINLVAYSWALDNLKKNDIILISEMEHHSNIVPWQFIAKKTGCILKYIPILEEGSLDLNSYKALLSSEVKFISLIHQSNVLGTINPIKEIIQIARNYDLKILIDAAQSISHDKIDVKSMDCDFLVFSGHKIFASTGVGVLFGKKDILNTMNPFMYGGQMINRVGLKESTWNDVPYRFEAGTPNIAEVISLGPAIEFIESIGQENMSKYLKDIYNTYLDLFKKYSNITIYGNTKNTGPVISFNIKNIHAYDFCQIMGQHNICMRAGNHCAQPLIDKLGVSSLNRISFQIYNTVDEINYFEEKLNQTIKLLS
ncbi:SufS family cysteine desulfurase [Candidatus Marinimicrobia bacterium]|jgi:cysteine desulfurase/selenocysteine lyase|nr:SufS family cysteine desulfurase [Candidatus Neomarinimicrobiota bacterium]|tara:strand:+ start:770 stop:1972 length:1203 start_codon:yes stop_codon:yes gene_type:complete